MKLLGTERVRRAARYGLVALGFVVVFGTHLTLTSYYLDSSRMGADEGIYAIAARSAMEGQLPYRDFAYTQMPLLPYLNGLAMALGGFGLTNQRVANIIWSCLALLGVILALRHRLGRWEPGLVAAFAVAASPHWAEMQSIGTSHGAAGMALGLSAAVVLTRFPLRRRAIAFAALGTLAVGIRLSCGPVVAVLALILIAEAPSWKERLVVAAIPAGVAAAGLLPFLIAAPEQMLFNVWYYHLASVFDRRSLAQAIEWWHISPAAILILLTGLMGLPSLIKRREWSVALLLIAALIGVTTPMIPKSAYGVYITPAAIVAATAGVTAFWTVGPAAGNPFRHIVWLLPLLVLYHPLPRTTNVGTATEPEAIGAYLREHVPPGPVLTPVPIVAIESDRDVIPGTEMGMFAAMHPRDRKLARRLNLVTIRDLTKLVADQRPAAIVKMKGSSKWNFKWTVPTLRRQPKKNYRKFEVAMRKHYRLAKRFRTMEVLVRR